MTARRSPFYALCLLTGALLFGVAGLSHPVLRGDGAEQLVTIAGTSRWHLIHWALLFGLPLMLLGLAGYVERHVGPPGTAGGEGGGPARAGLIVATFAFAVWGINILFMAGAGAHLAATYQAAEPGLTATHAVLVYDMLHPFGLAAERLATFALGLAFYLLGWGSWHGRVVPRWTAWGAFGVGAVCALIGLVAAETSVLLFYAQGTAVIWMAAVGALQLVRR